MELSYWKNKFSSKGKKYSGQIELWNCMKAGKSLWNKAGICYSIKFNSENKNNLFLNFYLTVNWTNLFNQLVIDNSFNLVFLIYCKPLAV